MACVHVHVLVWLGGGRVICTQENNDIVLNYSYMCMHWNSTLMIYTHSSYVYNVNIQESIQCVWMMTSYDPQSVFSVSQIMQPVETIQDRSTGYDISWYSTCIMSQLMSLTLAAKHRQRGYCNRLAIFVRLSVTTLLC